MNILHTETLKKWGGQQNKVLNEMIMLRELGYNVFLIANPNSEIAIRAKKNGFKVFEIEMNKKNFFNTVPFFLKIIKKKKIDVIFTHGHTDTIIGAITKILAKNIKFVRERHNLFPVNSFFSKKIHSILADKVCVLSESIKEYMKKIGVKEEKIFILPSIVDVDKFDNVKSTFREEFNISKDALVIGMFTSLYRKKGVFDFIEVVEKMYDKYPNAYFVFAGEVRENVKKVLREKFKNKNRVIVTGYREDSANVMKGFDIYVFPSYSEGLGTVLLEAMASKVPIVVYDKKPMSDLILNEERGLCARYKDVEDLRLKIETFINDKELRDKCSLNAFEFVKTHYDKSVLKKKLKELMENL